MGQQMRQLMANADGFKALAGNVELDEAYVGGRRLGKRGRGAAGKTIVLGMVERGDRMGTAVIPDAKKTTLREVTPRNVEPGSTASTDELMSYGLLSDDGDQHGSLKHGAKEFAYYDYRHGATHHTNTVESFWTLFKASFRSTHIHISSKYMQRYLDGFNFRATHRQMVNRMFDLLIGAVLSLRITRGRRRLRRQGRRRAPLLGR
jgi:transposase-like protein